VLSRGWKAPDREIVIESQRVRLIEALTDLAANNGLETVTIAEIVARAGVSKPTFYDHFENKDACFIAVLEAAMIEMSTRLLGSFDVETPRLERASRVLGAFLDFVVDDEDMVRIILIEAESAGPLARKRTRDFQKLIADAFVAQREFDRESDPTLPVMSEVRGFAAVGAVVEPIRKSLREGNAATVREDLYDELKVVVDLLLMT
jgi:AcrR family transcriptional regulator